MDSRGHNLYREKIRHMCEENLSSFEVDYNVLAAECSVLAFFLPEAPTEMLQVRYRKELLPDLNQIIILKH